MAKNKAKYIQPERGYYVFLATIVSIKDFFYNTFIASQPAANILIYLRTLT